MTSKSIRRLAADHAALHKKGLPPNYMFLPASSSSSSNSGHDPSNLGNLSVLLAGPDGTAYSAGVFRLELEIPAGSYPQAPPTARFRTKIFHPNVDAASGSVCVDTLKRDWKPELTLRDVLVTIGCLLVCPNPASALNAEAGRLMETDFNGFERTASMWARIHAACPPELRDAVDEAKRRVEGENGPPDKDKAAKSTVGRGKKRRDGDEGPVGPVVPVGPVGPVGPMVEGNHQSENMRDSRPDIKIETAALLLPTSTPMARSSFLAPRDQHSASGLGLGLDSSFNLDSSTIMDLDTPTQAPPPAAPPRPPKRNNLPPPSGKRTTTPKKGNSAPSFATVLSTPTPSLLPLHADANRTGPPTKRRRTDSPPPPNAPAATAHQLLPSTTNAHNSNNNDNYADRSGESSSSLGLSCPWLYWNHVDADESTGEPQSRPATEQIRMEAVKGDLQRYNSGSFGPRRGILRL